MIGTVAIVPFMRSKTDHLQGFLNIQTRLHMTKLKVFGSSSTCIVASSTHRHPVLFLSEVILLARLDFLFEIHFNFLHTSRLALLIDWRLGTAYVPILLKWLLLIFSFGSNILKR